MVNSAAMPAARGVAAEVPPNVLVDNFHSSTTEHGYGDATGDGYVDLYDYSQWSSQDGTDYTRWPSVEPGMILVSTTTDELDTDYSVGDLSLREAIALAATNSGADTIQFRPSLFASSPATIALTYDGPDSGTVADELRIDSNVTIDGPGADLVTIDGSSQNRPFFVNSGIEATIRGLTISAGAGVADGGGIYVAGNVTLDQVVVAGNVASQFGGAIYVLDSGTLNLLQSTVDGNTAVHGGGIFGHFGAGERLYISESTISNNSAVGGNGGGLTYFGWTSGGAASLGTIVNSTFSGNSATYSSGGIRVRFNTANLTLVNSTIADNVANYAAGIDLIDSPLVTLHNTISADNHWSGGGANNSNIGGTLQSASTFNLIGPGGNGGLANGTNGNIVLATGQSAGLAPLANYGGPTKTHALLATSLAIDAGDNMVAEQFDLSIDQRGEDRIVDWDSDLDLGVDIGAVELAVEELYS